MGGRPRKDPQKSFREDLVSAETWAQHYLDRSLMFKKMGWEVNELKYYEYFLYFSSRRRWFLKELLRVQLKEFDYEPIRPAVKGSSKTPSGTG